jgi:hypothetical protein
MTLQLLQEYNIRNSAAAAAAATLKFGNFKVYNILAVGKYRGFLTSR